MPIYKVNKIDDHNYEYEGAQFFLQLQNIVTNYWVLKQLRSMALENLILLKDFNDWSYQ